MQWAVLRNQLLHLPSDYHKEKENTAQYKGGKMNREMG